MYLRVGKYWLIIKQDKTLCHFLRAFNKFKLYCLQVLLRFEIFQWYNTLFQILDWEILLLFHTIQLAKSLPFHTTCKPEAWKASTRFKFCLPVQVTIYRAPLFATVVTMRKKGCKRNDLGTFCWWIEWTLFLINNSSFGYHEKSHKVIVKTRERNDNHRNKLRSMYWYSIGLGHVPPPGKGKKTNYGHLSTKLILFSFFVIIS